MPYEPILFRKAEAVLLEEKANKLFGITRLLDSRLNPDLLSLLDPSRLFSDDEKPEAIVTLSRVLTPIADEIASAFPGVGVGYYALCVDSIVAYAPSDQFGDKVGISVWPEHVGRRAMRERRETVGVGSMVRGDIMNCVRPLIRGEQVIGFVWANEAIEDIYRQMHRSEQSLYFSHERLETLLGLTGLLILSAQQLVNVRKFLHNADGGAHGPRGIVDGFVVMQRYLEMFLNTIDSGMVVLDSEDQALFLNAKAKEFFQEVGLAHPETMWEAFSFLGLPDLRLLIERMQAQNIRHQVLRAKTSGFLNASREINLHIARLQNGNNPYFLLIIEDLEQIKEKEEYQWRATKLAAAGEVAVALAHEIRNPLTVIRGSIRLLPDRLHDRDFLLRLAEVLDEEIGHINNTLEALLTFTRVSEPRFETINLINLFENIAKLVEPYASSHGVQVKLDNCDQDILIQGDVRYLRQAFLNLILNAIQAMPDGGTLSLRSSRRAGSNLVDVFVQDTGVGIPRSDQKKIFDVFFTKSPGGVGLGLALVQRIIDEHQGFIRLESEVGKGTTFTITLPIRRYSFDQEAGSEE